ncbi:E3 ubiquitin-protein ligase Os04g0590900 [Brachypodium distachyon]|uniref:RING-type domain-containing protein n=1 Tax=Brachypodium distachyon TaxID=15368 RepID=A0A0Q3NHN3_BRADI|nr:E3 ubiquitin-protein ligase Os04g0590900 [Brachypodium distachyon]KQK16926.1 hypothetical protein BRADI_1g31456v3 [Brachypodium distachyon]|eukprot:XP_010229727.1 E3 ubiquitin-protein ligase Os04g0590900 [Brachypodium distachyon]
MDAAGVVGAAYMLVTLLGIFGTLVFFLNRCAGAGAGAAEPVPAEAEAGPGRTQGGLLPFYVFLRAVQSSLQIMRPPAGLSDSAIAALPLAKVAQAAECAVCLGELAMGEAARLLPLCRHRFHVECVDTWLRSRANCPVCRQTVNDVNAQPAAQAEGPVVLPPALPQADGRGPLAQAPDGGEGHISLQVLD